jgi:hypothetical protein
VLGGAWHATDTGEAIHEDVPRPRDPSNRKEHYLNAELRADWNHYNMSRSHFPGDMLPVANTMMGPGSLATFLGSEPGFAESTVWFSPCWREIDNPESLPPLRFDPDNQWWRLTEQTLRECRARAGTQYMVGCPDLVENIDILAALRDPQTLLIDLIERPEWVMQKVAEINQVWFEAYSRIYEIIRTSDGGSAFCAYALWGPGKTAKVQCDASAMFSPAMFEQFVVPSLTQQCEWVNYSMFHLDGHECIAHLDALLAIDALDAIEWTPDPNVPNGGDPCWYEMYGKILAAGKSVQAVGVSPKQVVPLLDAVGGKGLYIQTDLSDPATAEELLAAIEAYR